MTHVEPVLCAKTLSKQYGENLVVSKVSFSLFAGEILGLLGPNGAGKSTTLGMLYGAVIPNEGFVNLCGLDIRRDGKKARSNLGVVPQGETIDSELPVRSDLFAVASYYGLPRALAAARVDELLSRFQLSSYASKGIDTLSGGLKRRLALARALVSQPKVVFLDEPTTGLDPDARQQFWGDVLELKKRGCAVLLTTHYMDEAERLCDRIIILQKGHQIDEGPPQELIERHVGKEVLELSGVAPEKLEQLAREFSTWSRRFADGFLLGCPSEAYFQEITKLLPERQGKLRLTRRAGTLEDVFLLITGSPLS